MLIQFPTVTPRAFWPRTDFLERKTFNMFLDSRERAEWNAGDRSKFVQMAQRQAHRMGFDYFTIQHGTELLQQRSPVRPIEL